MRRNAEISNDMNHPRDIDASLACAPEWFKKRAMEIRNAPNEAAVRAICSRSAKPVEQRSAAPASSLADEAWQQFTKKFPTPAAFREARKREADASDESRTCRRALLNSLLN
jgi:hypothetical protein